VRRRRKTIEMREKEEEICGESIEVSLVGEIES
jgi:hypothetical protein